MYSNFPIDPRQQVLTSWSTSVAFLKSSSHLRQILYLARFNIPKTHESRCLRI